MVNFGELIQIESRVQRKLLLAATCMYCWEAVKRSQVAITELLLFRKSTGIVLRDALPASQRLCANGPFEDCQVRMFVKQRTFPSANVYEAGLIVKCKCF